MTTAADMSTELVKASGCTEPAATVRMPVRQLAAAVVHQSGSASHTWDGLPAGLVMHTARSGSTAVANTLAAVPRAISLSEPEFIAEALTLGADELVRTLRHLNVNDVAGLVDTTPQRVRARAIEIRALSGG
jgi:hypothetical protein